jgi:predicted short-subunit dehydrogenase-like oxidoreductase (DUF2520 family)
MINLAQVHHSAFSLPILALAENVLTEIVVDEPERADRTGVVELDLVSASKSKTQSRRISVSELAFMIHAWKFA